ncbi:hypothetical protein BD309DRAFT_931572 [Dichomitus squalens]|uniref:Uncharacterized protein n=1 Tax=Dichomitus squalens (strain LYAD-421) TaxID=732165 RepID=R7SQB4_DICSQ|nr:uncharacterized protein DICSQDRAFT_139611 [Dichomitus squalens LYAD-421 SS1]EJF58118.1 hypothetical protein DICSQDRAFT_139611 [Dichomitus squalens LYAD-421 SS1]TBU37922.1 hypothetical protein BD309DRAFT_931572 [Dichomitus squalens]
MPPSSFRYNINRSVSPTTTAHSSANVHPRPRSLRFSSLNTPPTIACETVKAGAGRLTRPIRLLLDHLSSFLGYCFLTRTSQCPYRAFPALARPAQLQFRPRVDVRKLRSGFEEWVEVAAWGTRMQSLAWSMSGARESVRFPGLGQA